MSESVSNLLFQSKHETHEIPFEKAFLFLISMIFASIFSKSSASSPNLNSLTNPSSIQAAKLSKIDFILYFPLFYVVRSRFKPKCFPLGILLHISTNIEFPRWFDFRRASKSELQKMKRKSNDIENVEDDEDERSSSKNVWIEAIRNNSISDCSDIHLLFKETSSNTQASHKTWNPCRCDSIEVEKYFLTFHKKKLISETNPTEESFCYPYPLKLCDPKRGKPRKLCHRNFQT